MSERWGDSRRDRESLDEFITRDDRDARRYFGVPDDGYDGSQADEYDPPCPQCGQPCSDHQSVQVTTADGDDYETQACPTVMSEPGWVST